MMKEIVVISQGIPDAVASEYSPEAALQVLRGPERAVERGERRQKTPGKPKLLPSSPNHPGVVSDYSREAAPIYQSVDVRLLQDTQIQSSGDQHIKIIQEMNLLSWEKKNGSIFIPSVKSRQKGGFCPLCTNNLCICLGPSCLGKGPIASSYSAPSRVKVDLFTPDSKNVLTSLTSPEETPKKKEPFQQHYLPTCNIYNWEVLNKQEHCDRFIQQPIMRNKANWNLKLKLKQRKLKPENVQVKYLFQSVKRLLMKSSLNPSSTQAQKKTQSTSSVMTSHDRKMLCSEQRCIRKVSRSSTVSFNSPTSSSTHSNLPPNSTVISSTSFTRSSVLPSNSLASHSASSKSPTNHTTVSLVLSTPRPIGYLNITKPRISGWSNSVFGLKGGSGRSKSSRASSSRVCDNVEECDDSRGRTTERCSEHERSASTGIEKHICKCGKSFAHKRSLSRHYEECLTNEHNPFMAPQVFSSPSLRKRSTKRSSVPSPLTPHSSGAKICKEEESIASSVEPIGDVFELTVFEEDDSAAAQFFKCKC